jgi:hypothetical protein
MVDLERARRAQEAVMAYLYTLLLRPGPYRDKWFDEASRSSLRVVPGCVNQEAVRRLIADYLWHNDSGLEYDPRTRSPDFSVPRYCKDIVNRALGNQLITARTLLLFVETFEMDDEDREKLWLLFAGEELQVD